MEPSSLGGGGVRLGREGVCLPRAEPNQAAFKPRTLWLISKMLCD